jgi:hypothetical protein
VSEYFEFLAARMDAPLLDHFEICFFHQVVFNIPQIIRFFDNSKSFNSSSLALEFDRFKLGPYDPDVSIFFPSSCINPDSWTIDCEGLDWRVISLAQICNQILLFRSTVDELIIRSGPVWVPPPAWDPAVDPTVWLQLFHSFPSVRSLQLSATLLPSITPALKGLTGESAAELFPLLRSLSIIGGPDCDQDGIQSFIAARQQSGHPVALVP